MTHEELLDKLHDFEMNECYENECASSYHALRAVVELHKPQMYKPQNKRDEELGLAKCDGCYLSYPCPTIQAIEKELNG